MPRVAKNTPEPPATPKSTVSVTGPVKVKHKSNGKTYVVSKKYFEKYSERLEVIDE